MDRAIIDMASATMTEDDTLYLLGDILWKDSAHYRDLLCEIPGTLVLISGNHDGTFAKRSKAERVKRRWLEDSVFDSILDKHTIKIDGRSFDLNHFPYVMDSRHDGKYQDYLAIDRGNFLLHGHVHDSWTWRSNNQLNVGIDVHAGRLISEHDVISWANFIENSPGEGW